MNANQEVKFQPVNDPIAVWNAIVGKRVVARDQHGCMWVLDTEPDPCSTTEPIDNGWRRIPLVDRSKEEELKAFHDAFMELKRKDAETAKKPRSLAAWFYQILAAYKP